MTDFAQHLRIILPDISKQHRNMFILIGIWVIVMISVPIQKWVWGDGIIPFAITLGLLLQFVTVLYVVYAAWGFKRAILTFTIVAIITWFAEYMGSTTGLPFGNYHYTNVLQPQFAGVPLVIPIAWFMMLPSAWAVAQVVIGASGNTNGYKYLYFIGVSALAFTAWDLFLDPQMVAWGMWIWDNPSGYFGIPWINYAGWIFTASIVTAIVRPRNLPEKPLVIVYGVVWFLQSVGQFFFWGQPGPAIAGCLVMGAFLLLATRRLQGRSS